MSVKTGAAVGTAIAVILAAIVISKLPTAEYSSKDKDSVTFKVYWDRDTASSDLRITWSAPPLGEKNVRPGKDQPWHKTVPYSSGHLHLDARNIKGTGTNVICHIIIIHGPNVTEIVRTGEKQAICDAQ